MRVLIVDDDVANLRLLDRLLSLEGHECTTAENGRIALEIFDRVDPELVLLDVQMPELDGYQVAEHLKSTRQPDRFVPILFLTALSDEKALARCLECGGDDFLSKPYSRMLLRAKVHALQRIHDLHSKVCDQAQELRHQRQLVENDLRIAERVMAKITGAAQVSDPGLFSRVESLDQFCGDLIVAQRTPSGGVMALLGDLTGHGLPAAVCAMPVVETFSIQAARGHSVSDIASAINEKLVRQLSTGLFCAAALIEIDRVRSRLTVWNGGLPDLVLLDASGAIARRMRSTHLALGVVPDPPNYRSVEVVELEPGQQLFACSDGLTEAR
ncbi:MAG: SpoIIE family protein phosphatase, partial [Planctomycetes bacterium]|nr:SpoIIE family protein phosphatase [Planctomycetota bacterium]